MGKTKIYKKGVRYYSNKKGIFGLTLGGTRNSGWKDDFYVREDMSSDHDPFKRKIVCRGTITECRAYMKKRFWG